MKQFLSSHERDFLKTQHRMERDKRVCDRIKDVRAYIENSKIKMHFLPPYSPNLDPIERLTQPDTEEGVNCYCV